MTGKQHVDLYRKILLRRQLLRWAPQGACYVPFIGDGDIAAECYTGRPIFGADIDPERCAIASARIPDSDIRVYDCDYWPFPGCDAIFAVADFDAYAYPYESFRSWWHNAKKADTVVVFFTDAQRQAINRGGHARFPDGTPLVTRGMTANQRRPYSNFWLRRYCLPYLSQTAAPYRVVTNRCYLRGLMVYWGAVLTKSK